MPETLTCLTCGTANRVPSDKLSAGPKCGNCGDKLLTGKPVETDLSGLEKAMKRDSLPIVVDLWAPWCGPCRAMAPEFSRAAAEMRDKARFVKINTDDNPDAARRFAVRGIPTLLLLKGGNERARHSGVMRANDLIKWVGKVSQPA